ncbi:MAG: aminotransferase family protein [Chloroflexota bacterium]
MSEATGVAARTTVGTSGALSRDEIAQLERDYVMYPWTPRQDAVVPRVVESAHGMHYVQDGREIMDFGSQLAFMNVGHTHPRVVDAVIAQVKKLPVIGSTLATEAKARLAQKLAQVTPGALKKTFFSTGGAEAVEAATMVAKAFTGRRKIITRYRAYHGATYAGMGFSADQRSWQFTPGIPDVVHVPEPYCYRCPFGLTYPSCELRCAQHVEQVIKQEGAEYVAAVMVEPIQGAGGIIVPPPEYMPMLRKITRDHGVMLIADEVMTGFGRTGRWFACEHWDVEPDIMTMAKGITCGYVPLAATIVSEEIAKFFDDHPWVHGHTYTGHTLGAAAANAVLRVYEDENLIQNSAEVGAYLFERACELREKHPSVGDVRGKGLFVGVELVRSRQTREPIYDWTTGEGGALKQKVLKAALDEGLYVMGGNASVLMLCPPLIATRADVDTAVEILDHALAVADAEYRR